MKETGLIDKINQFSMYISYKINTRRGYVFADREQKDAMQIDEFKIAPGPYLFGMTIAIFILSVELFFIATIKGFTVFFYFKIFF